MTQWLKNWLAIQETQEMQVRSLGQGDSLEEKMARGLSRVEAGNPGFPRLVQVTSGGFSWWL